ncbi:MAG: hypothetical protein JNK05_32050 [Myxococcales bacterium]|nr:hypothetical protein [Myxococcales bacterium]
MATPKKSAKKKPRSTAGTKPVPFVDAKKISKLAARYRALLAQMHAALVSEMRGWDSYYEAVDEVVSKKLYVADGYENAKEWLQEHVDETERTALRYARVARLASPEEIAKYTATKIDFALSIRDAKEVAEAKKKGVELERDPDEAKSIDLAAQRYSVKRNNEKLTVDLEEVKTPELRAILRAFGTRPSRPEPSMSDEAARAKRAFSETAGLEGVTVEERDSTVTVRGFRPDQMGAVGDVLREASRR